IGRRSDSDAFNFAGLIDDVRIYSRALGQDEIIADMGGRAIDASGILASDFEKHRETGSPKEPHGLCPMSDREDARLPGACAALGVLVAVACVGLWPSGGPLLSVAVSVATAILFPITLTETLPSFARWMMTIATLAGAMSVVLFVRRTTI